MIELINVSKSYRSGEVRVAALENISVEIAEGEFVALAGPSGSGKTTLLNLIGCIDKPDTGRIRIAGTDVTGVSFSRLAVLRRELIGFIFQTFNLLPVLSAFENVEYPLLFSQFSKKARHRAVWQWLEHVGLANHARQRPDQLSGGQRQRVAIARAMITQPRVVLADEPTANLDSESGDRILDLLAEVNRSTRVTFLFSTHDPRLIDRAERRIRVRDGRITSDEAAWAAAGRCTP